jgi:hypothetical protein
MSLFADYAPIMKGSAEFLAWGGVSGTRTGGISVGGTLMGPGGVGSGGPSGCGIGGTFSDVLRSQ